MILLREKREESRLSQAELARISGVKQQTISSIESDQHANPTIQTVIALAKALGCEVADLVATDQEDE